MFEVQFTAGQFGWVVVYLERVDRDELAELTYEAWSLSAPAVLVEAAAGCRLTRLVELDGEGRLGDRGDLLLGHARRQGPEHQPVGGDVEARPGW